MTWNRVLAGLGAVYALSLAALFVLPGGLTAIYLAFTPAMGVFCFVGCVAALRAAAVPGSERRSRVAWRAVAGSFLVQVVTLVLFALPGTKISFPAPADVSRICFVLLLCVASQAFPLRSVSALERRKSVFDALTVVVSASMVLWYLILGPYVSMRGTSAAVVAAAVTYPVLDLLLIFGFARVLVRGAGTSARPPIMLLGGGALVLFGRDSWVGYVQAHSDVVFRNTAWHLACALTIQFLFSAAAADQARVGRGSVYRPGRCHVGSNLPYAAIGVGYVLMVIAALREGDLYPWSGLVLGGIGITLLVVLRQIMVQRESARAAATDGLTGLANRSRFHEILANGLDRDGRNGRGTAVLLVDLNGFKQINDSLGHKAGDRLLSAFARMLREAILGSDEAGRLGGDEFAVVLHDIGTPENAAAVARRIVSATAEPIMIDGTAVRASASIGIALSAPGELSPDELLHRADVAMYHAKRRDGADDWAHFADDMGDGDDDDEPSLENELRAAIEGGLLRLEYLPVVGLPDEELIGVEALVRWDHPRRGVIEPEVIIPLAERAGVIGDLGRWVLREACTRAQNWPGLQLNVNVSPRQLEEDRFSADVRAIIRSTGMDPALLVLEFAESALIAAEVPRAHLRILSDEGVRIALDDFGTGYSGLSYLTHFPVHTLKIDRSFVKDLPIDHHSAELARAIVSLGRSLNMELVAVGVETEDQARHLAGMGCHLAQGWLLGRPLAEGAFDALLDQASNG
ncbi:MAG: bifunctional diguanylate cyclase/phosphodiesterase [Actinoplanes sp.]